MARIAIAALILALAGCTQEPPPDQRVVKLTLVADAKAVAVACDDSGIIEDLGCAKGSAQHPEGKGLECHIVAIRPRGFDDERRLQTLGHELLHCFTGPVHY